VLGDGVVLRLLRDDDIDDIFGDDADPLTARYLPELHQPYTADDARFWLDRVAPATWTAGGATFAVADPDSDRLLGSISLAGVRMRGRMGAIGYWTAPWARGRGVATRAARTISTWAYSLGIQRLELQTDLTNAASQRVALGAGFRFEGVRRAAGKDAGDRLTDRAVWTRLDTDSGEPVRRVLPDRPGGTLTDGVVTLRPVTVDDTDRLFALHSLPEVVATSVRTVTAESTRTRCAQSAFQWLSGQRADLAICDAETGAFAGDIGLFHVDPIGQGMIGYSLMREYRGRAFTSRAARLVVDWAFAHAGLVRVVAGTAPDNIASQRTLERAGFTREGYEPMRLPGPDGSRVDNVAFGITAPR